MKKSNKPYAVKDTLPDLAKLNNWLETATEYHKKKHWEYFVIDQFLRGNHNINANTQTNTIELSKNNDSINYPINKIYSTFRAVRGYVTRHKPVITVEPENDSKEAKDYARRANKLLERDNRLNNSRKINKELVYYGVKYGIGYRQVGFDPVRRCSIRWSIDPFDLLSGDPYGEALDAPFIIKVVKRTVGYLKYRFPEYADKFAPDNELAYDEYKKLGYQIIYGQSTLQTKDNDSQTKLVYECWYRVYTPNKYKGLINKCTFIDSEILDNTETAYTEYPFIPYKSDIIPNEAQGEGHIKHIIAPQRMLNMLNTQLLTYNHIVNHGRYLVDRASGIKIINTKEGQIIYKNKNGRVEVLNPPQVNPLLKDQLVMADGYIEDIGGQHDASIGGTPDRVTSGKAIETLQLGDSNNISDLRDNFEDALEMEASWILKMYSLFENQGIPMNDKLKDGGQDMFTVFGSEAVKNRKFGEDKVYMADNGGYNDVFKVLSDNNVKASVISQLGETKQARLELLFKLIEVGLPLKVLLEHLEFPNTSDILERIGEEALADIQMEQMKAQNAQAIQQTTPPLDEKSIPTPDNTEALQELSSLREQARKELNG